MREAGTAMDKRDFVATAGGVGRVACMALSRPIDEVAANVRTAAQRVEYDTCSGDSCWVRQYLEWCDPVIALRTETDIGLVPAGGPRFHAI